LSADLPESTDTETIPAAAGSAGKPMGFLDHLEELRITLLKSALVFAVFVAIIGYYLDDAATLLNWPLEQARAAYPQLRNDLVTTSPMGVFSVIINVCVIGGVLLSLPFWLFFTGQFVAPALTRGELRVAVPAGLSAMALFLAGAGFSYYFLVPSTIRVSFELNELLGYTVMWTAENYYGLLMWLVLGVGAAFEFPLLVVLANYLGLVEVATLKKYRRHAIVVFFIIAAIVTPTPDPINQTFLAVPLCLLYELSIWVCTLTGRRKRQPT
jgi:sec-independent protein translocase protein TatC